jgi:hypothetical protein
LCRYSVALDQIPSTAKEVRFKIMRNIGIAFLRWGSVQVESSCDPELESAWLEPLNLKCDILVSKFANVKF